MWMLEQLLGMVSAKYKRDKTSPGVVISKLVTGRYYGSIARYEDPWTKVVVCHCYGESFEATINNLAIRWCEMVNLPVPTRQAKDVILDRFDLIEIK